MVDFQKISDSEVTDKKVVGFLEIWKIHHIITRYPPLFLPATILPAIY